MKNILITGGSGFIGSNILESGLREEYELIAPSRSELDWRDAKGVAAYFARHYFDVVIHTAAMPAHRNVADVCGVLEANSTMTQNLLQNKGRWGKLLHMGSGSAYDMRHYQPKMKETYLGTHIPADGMGYSKYLLGKQLDELEGVYDLRLFGVFGKYEDYAIRFISNAICKALFDLPITIKQNRKFDYLYIDDLILVLAHFIEHDPKEKAFNVTPDKAIELLQLARIVKDISGKDLPIQVALPGMGMEYSGDNTLLNNELKKVNFTSIEDAVGSLYQWYAAHKHTINKELLLIDK